MKPSLFSYKQEFNLTVWNPGWLVMCREAMPLVMTHGKMVDYSATSLTPCILKYTNEFTHSIENPPKP